MAVGDKLQCSVIVESKRFYSNDNCYGIINACVSKVEEGKPKLDPFGCAVFKGEMPEPKIGCQYMVSATEVEDPKWGIQYEVINMCSKLDFDEDDARGKRSYLETLFTERQIESMYDTLEDPYKTLKENDVESLVKVKGCGLKTVSKWLDRFNENFAMARIFVELKEYEITSKMAKALYSHYHSPDVIIQTIRKNPYTLMDVSGFGWKKCDELALKGGMDKFCKERVEAFIRYYLSYMAEDGFTYVYSNSQLMNSIIEEFGDEIPDAPITDAINHLGKTLWWSDDHEKVGLSKYISLEKRIANELIRIRDGENRFNYSGWEEKIKQKEKEQGWEYTDQQWEGIRAVLENQVVIITGLAGTGKSSVVAGMIEILKNYSYAQCALAGRAAARLSEITNKDGYTIHRLLGYPKGDKEHNKFLYHEFNPLDYSIIILDEISMVNGELFYSLLKAIETGSKLIMLGDVGQLESIGCSNIAHDLIESPEIKSIELTKIHRQAAASAIISESIRARNGIQVISKDWVGVETRGELKDLTYDCYSDKGNTFYKIMQYVSILLSRNINVLDFQVIVPIKERDAGTWNLNVAIQELCNPQESNKKEIFIKYDKSHSGFLRIGDKVINTKNNYKTVAYDGQWDIPEEDAEDVGEITPIYNGNIGVITKVNEQRKEVVVDFIGIGEVLIGGNLLNSLLLGYAITCHKLQGSECDYVIFGMDFSSYILLTRELVYTAITRAKKHCYVVSQNSALRYAVEKNSVCTKQTILQEALYEITHPKIIF